MADDNRIQQTTTATAANDNTPVPWYRWRWWRVVATLAIPVLSLLCPVLPAPASTICSTVVQVGRVVDAAMHAAPASSSSPTSWRADGGTAPADEPIPYPPMPGDP